MRVLARSLYLLTHLLREKLGSVIVTIHLTDPTPNILHLVRLIAWEASSNQLLQHRPNDSHSQVHVSQVLRHIQGASDDVHVDKHC